MPNESVGLPRPTRLKVECYTGDDLWELTMFAARGYFEGGGPDSREDS